MNVKEIILEKIKVAGADGLCNSDGECGCGDDDLFPCCNSMDGFLDCQLARAVLAKDYCKTEDCENCPFECDSAGEACTTKLYLPLTERSQ